MTESVSLIRRVAVNGTGAHDDDDDDDERSRFLLLLLVVSD